jgi:hypothetical protein
MYGIIFEHKAEGPLIMETYPLTYEKASELLKSLSRDPHIIRVAIFSLKYETGNKTLIKEIE